MKSTGLVVVCKCGRILKFTKGELFTEMMGMSIVCKSLKDEQPAVSKKCGCGEWLTVKLGIRIVE